MIENTHQKPPKIKPSLKAAPKIRNLYWCDFPSDAHLPEFWKRRPVIIVSYRQKLHGSVTIVPCSTQPQDDNEWAYPLKTTIDEQKAWAICDKITTLAISRLTQDKRGIRRLPEDEFDEILKIVLKWLPNPKG